MRTVWFHRKFTRLQGGHLKHSHYFGHVAATGDFTPRISFAEVPCSEATTEERRELWPPGEAGYASRWFPNDQDLLFVAGMDWQYLAELGLDSLPNPRINLIQGVRHGRPGTELYDFLARKAVRICVSQEVADSINATGRVNGPVLVIPNGIDIEPVAPFDDDNGDRRRSALIVGYKQPRLAREIARRLEAADVEHHALMEFLPRKEYLEMLPRHQVAVCLPLAEEGFYLPALEAMASGCVVVTTDCIGNREYCAGDRNCLVADRDAESLVASTMHALNLSQAERRVLRVGARATAMSHSLGEERRRFHTVLRDIDSLWASA